MIFKVSGFYESGKDYEVNHDNLTSAICHVLELTKQQVPAIYLTQANVVLFSYFSQTAPPPAL